MITKPEQIIKRIIKAVGERQAVILIGNWQEELIKRIKERQNIVHHLTDGKKLSELTDNSFTRIIADYSQVSAPSSQLFFIEVRRLLLPTGFLIITANTKPWLPEKILNFITGRKVNKDEQVKTIRPKVLQNEIHDNGFLIDGYYCYPEGHLLMIAQIQNKEVTTLFTSKKQETIKTQI